MPGGKSLPLIFFVRRLISTMSMAPQRTQVVHGNKGNDKIIIAQSTHDTTTSPMTRSKAKSTSSLSTKQISESTCLLKSVRMCDEHQPLITLVFLGLKSHSPHSKGKLPSTLKHFGGKSPYSVINANSSTDLHFGSPTGMSKEENYSNHSDSFTSPFSMTMPVMTIDTTSVEEQLAQMARVIAKLTKTDEEKDMQIASLINKVEAQVQNMSESSQGLNHLSNVAFPLNDAPHAYRTMQVERQTIESCNPTGGRYIFYRALALFFPSYIYIYIFVFSPFDSCPIGVSADSCPAGAP